MTGPGATLLSILTIASFVLAGGGVYVLIARRDVKKGLLMLLAALVTFANVIILTV